jgi:hypothetical protein
MTKFQEQPEIRDTSAQIQADLLTVRHQGAKALRRLLPVAQRDTGQSSVIARFLLNLYNGKRFPFDLTDFRRLDQSLFDDCLTVLQMDFAREKEVHEYFENGNQIWEKLAFDWNMRDFKNENWRTQ